MQRGSLALEKTHQAYLTRWVLPHWRHYELAEVRTIQVDSWLRRLPLAKSSCAKIRNLMSVLFQPCLGTKNTTRSRARWCSLPLELESA
jgi:hypothetical protein